MNYYIHSKYFSVSSRLAKITGIIHHNPCKNLTEISPRLARSRRDWRDLVEINEISPRSRRDLYCRRDLAEIGEISPRSRRDKRDLAEIELISTRSRRDL